MGIIELILLAIGLSMDALAVGVTFVAVPVHIIEAQIFTNTVAACIIIVVITFAFSAFGVRVGNLFGSRYRSGAEVAGGFVLICIGLKIILEHYGVIDFCIKSMGVK